MQIDISPTQCAAFLTNAFGKDIAQSLHVDLNADIGGAINSVFYIKNKESETHAILRIRTGEPFFGYEKGLVKESLIAGITNVSDPNDLRQNIIKRIAKTSGSDIEFTGSCNILYYEDHSIFGVPASILEHIEGPLLIHTTDLEHYKSFGKKLAYIHQTKFPNFAASLIDIDEEIDFSKKYQTQIAALLIDAHYLNNAEKEKVRAIAASLEPINTRPVLCHGDFHGYNAIIQDNDVCLIDWDNAVIDIPELDFAKAYYWTGLNEHGVLSHNAEKFKAIIEGYSQTSTRPLDQYLINIMALQWLIRVSNFEHSLQIAGKENKKHFPSLNNYYLPAIQNLLTELS